MFSNDHLRVFLGDTCLPRRCMHTGKIIDNIVGSWIPFDNLFHKILAFRRHSCSDATYSFFNYLSRVLFSIMSCKFTTRICDLSLVRWFNSIIMCYRSSLPVTSLCSISFEHFAIRITSTLTIRAQYKVSDGLKWWWCTSFLQSWCKNKNDLISTSPSSSPSISLFFW